MYPLSCLLVFLFSFPAPLAQIEQWMLQQSKHTVSKSWKEDYLTPPTCHPKFRVKEIVEVKCVANQSSLTPKRLAKTLQNMLFVKNWK